MFRQNTRLITTTEKGSLKTPLLSDQDFKSLLRQHMDSITESVRLNLTKKFSIDPDDVWTLEECKKVLDACIRKNNVKGIICCYREFKLSRAKQQAQAKSELEKQIQELHAKITSLTKQLNLKKSKIDIEEVSQPDNKHPDLQIVSETDIPIQSANDLPIGSVEVCGARRSKRTESSHNNTSVVQIQTVSRTLGPREIDRLSQSLPSARTNFSEFSRALISKMRLYDMSLTEVTQLMSQILTESEFNSFEHTVTSKLQHASKDDLREGVLKALKNIIGPKIDWSKVTCCVQRKDESVNEFTERFCQSAITYSGLADNSDSVLNDKGPLVRIWSDGLATEYRQALPFLNITWSSTTLRNNLNSLALWERDSYIKDRVRFEAAATKVNTEKTSNHKCLRKNICCHYCGKKGHWMRECRKNKKNFKEMNRVNQLLNSLLNALNIPLPSSLNPLSCPQRC